MLLGRSPEVMSSQPYDFKSDMWSLGCCLYEMMSLKHAFDATDMNSLVLKIMRGQHLPISQQVKCCWSVCALWCTPSRSAFPFPV